MLCFLSTLGAQAQFDPVLSHSWALPSYYNPAAAGLNGLLDVKAMYSKQMMGFEGSPTTMLIQADLPVYFIGPSHSAGLGFVNDQAGVFSTKQIFMQYAYHMRIKKGRLSFGLRPMLLSEGYDGSKLDIDDPSDPAFTTGEASGFGFDLDAGIRYDYRDLWYVGVSGMHCLGPTIKLGDTKQQEVKVKPMFHVMGGYKMKFSNPIYRLITHAQVRSDLQSLRADLHARLAYEGEKHKFYGGLNYSPTNSLGICLGYNIHGVKIGYSYEMYTGGIGALNGTHEVLLGYAVDLNLFKKGKNLHKSVRIL